MIDKLHDAYEQGWLNAVHDVRERGLAILAKNTSPHTACLEKLMDEIYELLIGE